VKTVVCRKVFKKLFCLIVSSDAANRQNSMGLKLKGNPCPAPKMHSPPGLGQHCRGMQVENKTAIRKGNRKNFCQISFFSGFHIAFTGEFP